MIVATCGVPVEFSAVNELILPVPLGDARPILTLSFVQS